MGLLKKAFSAMLAFAGNDAGRRARGYREAPEESERRRAMEEDERRMLCPLYFEKLSPAQFDTLVAGAASKTPRCSVRTVRGLTVELQVTSNSGLTYWNATVEFSDYGRLTGSYWFTSDNPRSSVPEYFADLVADTVRYIDKMIASGELTRREGVRSIWYSPDGAAFWNGHDWRPVPPGQCWNGRRWVAARIPR